MPRDRTTGRFVTAERITVTERLTIHDTPPAALGEIWARLTAPLQHYQVPVIITDAERAASDAYRDQLHAGHADDQDTLNEWHDAAQWNTFKPLLDWLTRPLYPEPLPDMTP